MISKRIGKKIYESGLFIFARPSMQKFNEIAFRVIIGGLGYVNFSEDFRLTGEKKLLKILTTFGLNEILDVGANSGQWARMALNNTHAKIMSFEPQSIPFKNLTKLKSEYPSRIELVNMGLGEKSSELEIFIHDSSSELSFIHYEIQKLPLLEGRALKKEKIKIVSLDAFMRDNQDFKNFDLIKIDTEGYELEVLLGAKEYIEMHKPKFIQIEMNWHQLYRSVTLLKFSELLKNYDVFQILPYGRVIHRIDPNAPVRNIFQLSNFLFARKDINLN